MGEMISLGWPFRVSPEERVGGGWGGGGAGWGWMGGWLGGWAEVVLVELRVET